MKDRIDSIGSSQKVEAFAKKRSAKRTRLAREVQGKNKELDIQRKAFLKKAKTQKV